MLQATNKKVKYKATGAVYGRYWGGGEGAYKARTLIAETKEALLKEAEEKVKDGSLDGGMGYEKVLGAILYIETITTVEIEGKTFENIETETEFVGDLKEEIQEWLQFEVEF